jgi:glycosyltransferase involved in cell wall biosynthesis
MMPVPDGLPVQASDLVSIVLPTRCGARYVCQAVRSYLDQIYPRRELIVADDASTGETPARAARFSDPRLRLLRHDTNRSVGVALNTDCAARRAVQTRR